eukprot:m.294157 g.294157  ORF g.294157 m.294157 type:complete len:61 (-) comp241885_c0_seq1:41-223(-)
MELIAGIKQTFSCGNSVAWFLFSSKFPKQPNATIFTNDTRNTKNDCYCKNNSTNNNNENL